MLVLKTSSPIDSPSAPKEVAKKWLPSSRINKALDMGSRLGGFSPAFGIGFQIEKGHRGDETDTCQFLRPSMEALKGLWVGARRLEFDPRGLDLRCEDHTGIKGDETKEKQQSSLPPSSFHRFLGNGLAPQLDQKRGDQNRDEAQRHLLVKQSENTCHEVPRGVNGEIRKGDRGNDDADNEHSAGPDRKAEQFEKMADL